MFIEKIKTPGLAHLSWIVGDKEQAAVIDPRRDIEVYLKIAQRKNVNITTILETHRNEDLISGSPLLAAATGARILHGPEADEAIQFADQVNDGDEVDFSGMKIKALHTPGHTNDSMSYAVYDKQQGGPSVAVFTGDALFIGDVGRCDFYPEKMRESAEKLYDSIQKILKLGDQTLLCPAHGAGSVCGSGMADREFSTLGHERVANPMLQLDSKQEFVSKKVEEFHYHPPYFSLIETLNSEGTEAARNPLSLAAIGLNKLKEQLSNKALAVDIRGFDAYASAHLPDSLCLPQGMISAYAGWLIKPSQEIILIASSMEQAQEAYHDFLRIGYDHIAGAFTQSLAMCAAMGETFKSTPIISAETASERMQSDSSNWSMLDVRKRNEWEQSSVQGAEQIFLGELPDKLADLQKTKRYTVFCASGIRASIGASILLRAGFEEVDFLLGSIAS